MFWYIILFANQTHIPTSAQSFVLLGLDMCFGYNAHWGHTRSVLWDRYEVCAIAMCMATHTDVQRRTIARFWVLHGTLVLLPNATFMISVLANLYDPTRWRRSTNYTTQ